MHSRVHILSDACCRINRLRQTRGRLCRLLLYLAMVAMSFPPLLHSESGDSSVFGTSKSTGGSLIGILYDLKQTQALEKLKMGPHEYDKVVNEFLSSDWDEAVLNRYFRVTQPVFTTQVFIPLGRASVAPVAFSAEKIVEPSFFMVHYKGQVSPPSAGRWRFWGYGSEVCSVAVNGKTVLSSNWIEHKVLNPIDTPDLDRKSSAPPGRPVHCGLLTAGTWMNLRADEVVDLDVLIGERAGGSFCAVLLIEKEGETYEQQDGHAVYPIFQLAPFDTPLPRKDSKAPPFARHGPIWKAAK